MTSPTIIVLSGPAASGKSTTATALQHRLDAPFLALELDMFIDALPGDPSDHSPDVFERMEQGYHRAVAATASAGNNVITDHYRADLDAELLSGYDTVLVGVRCPLNVLEAREQSRPPARRGFARQQFDEFHAGVEYDVEVNTERAPPAECAEQIATHYEGLSQRQ